MSRLKIALVISALVLITLALKRRVGSGTAE